MQEDQPLTSDDDIDVGLLEYLQTLTVEQRFAYHMRLLRFAAALREKGTDEPRHDAPAAPAPAEREG